MLVAKDSPQKLDDEEVTRMNRSSMSMAVSGAALVFALSACSQPLSTREKTTLGGGALGAGAGALIGSTVGSPGAGAAIGGALGAAGGGLVGDQMQRQEQEQYEQQRQLYENQQELERQRRDIERLERDDYNRY